MRLLSRSCTTGWFDWIWGELWLTPEGIARLSSVWAETRRMAREHRKRGGGTTVVESAADVDEISTVDIRQRIDADPKNRWVPFAAVQRARLRRGILNGRLRVQLRDGSEIKLLWLRADPAYHVLAEVLKDSLGPKLMLR